MGQLRIAAMALIHYMDSDEDQLQIQTYEGPEAYVFSTKDAQTRHQDNSYKNVPPQFDGQTSWLEYEDLIDDWLGITTLDADKHGQSVKNSLGGSSFNLQLNAQHNIQISGSWAPTFPRTRSDPE